MDVNESKFFDLGVDINFSCSICSCSSSDSDNDNPITQVEESATRTSTNVEKFDGGLHDDESLADKAWCSEYDKKKKAVSEQAF